MGKIATFRQSVLMRLRRRREHAARHAFERAKAQADVIRQRIAHLRKAVDIENGFVRQAIFSGEQAAREPAPPDSGVLLRYRRNIEQLRQVILADTLRLAEAERLLDWRRRELIEAIQQRKGAFILASGCGRRKHPAWRARK